jgi:hypothetical protein
MAVSNGTKLTPGASGVFGQWYSIHGKLASPEDAEVMAARGLPLGAHLVRGRPPVAMTRKSAASSPSDRSRTGARRFIDNQAFSTSSSDRSPLASWLRRGPKRANA